MGIKVVADGNSSRSTRQINDEYVIAGSNPGDVPGAVIIPSAVDNTNSGLQEGSFNPYSLSPQIIDPGLEGGNVLWDPNTQSHPDTPNIPPPRTSRTPEPQIPDLVAEEYDTPAAVAMPTPVKVEKPKTKIMFHAGGVNIPLYFDQAVFSPNSQYLFLVSSGEDAPTFEKSADADDHIILSVPEIGKIACLYFEQSATILDEYSVTVLFVKGVLD